MFDSSLASLPERKYTTQDVLRKQIGRLHVEFTQDEKHNSISERVSCKKTKRSKTTLAFLTTLTSGSLLVCAINTNFIVDGISIFVCLASIVVLISQFSGKGTMHFPTELSICENRIEVHVKSWVRGTFLLSDCFWNECYTRGHLKLICKCKQKCLHIFLPKEASGFGITCGFSPESYEALRKALLNSEARQLPSSDFKSSLRYTVSPILLGAIIGAVIGLLSFAIPAIESTMKWYLFYFITFLGVALAGFYGSLPRYYWRYKYPTRRPIIIFQMGLPLAAASLTISLLLGMWPEGDAITMAIYALPSFGISAMVAWHISFLAKRRLSWHKRQ